MNWKKIAGGMIVLGGLAFLGSAGANNGAAGSASVYWHCEGAPPLASKVCVTYGPNASNTECRTFACYPAGNASDYEIEVPAAHADDATYSVWVGPGVDDLVLGVVTVSDMSGPLGTVCEDLPLVGNQGMYFCQDPRVSPEISRNNTYYNKNATNGNGNGDVDVIGPPKKETPKKGTPTEGIVAQVPAD